MLERPRNHAPARAPSEAPPPAPRRGAHRLAAVLCVILLSFGSLACASDAARGGGGGESGAAAAGGAEAPEQRPGAIEPRYQPREPQPEPWYNDSYLFGMTRGVTSSTIHPAAQVPLLVLTIPLDIALLPFAAIGGLF